MAIQKGTGFTNLNRIMQANQGNKLGSTVSGGIQNQVQGVNTSVKSAQDQFNEQAQANRLDTDAASQKRSDILSRFAPSTGSTQTAATTTPAPVTNTATQPVAGLATPIQTGGLATKFVDNSGSSATGTDASTTAASAATPAPAATTGGSPVSDQEIQDFTKYRTGTYTGLSQLQDTEALQGKATQAQTLGGLTRSEGGRQELLRRFVGGNNYTQGQRQLDSSLLGQQPGQLGSAARQAQGAANTVDQATANASNLAQQYTNSAKQFGEDTVKQIASTRAPLSSQVDTAVANDQTTEQGRLDQLKKIQDALSGADPSFAKLDPTTRMGLALQQASNLGYLKQGDINMLLGENGQTGLIQRGMNLGLDVNSLINERLQNNTAQNVNRLGVADSDQVAKLNALDKLAGKQGSDLEFGNQLNKYAAGSTGLDINSLSDYISKSEGEKAQSDAAYASQLAQDQSKYLNQALAYGGGAINGANSTVNNLTSTPSGQVGSGVAGAGAGLGMYGTQAALGSSAGGEAIGAGALGGAEAVSPVALAAMLGVDTLTGSDNTAKTVQSLGDTGLNLGGAAAQGSNSILDGLLKLNVGGKSIADTAAGQQISKALSTLSQNENSGLNGASNLLGTFTGGVGGLTSNGIQDILSGNVGDLANNILGATGVNAGAQLVGNVGSAVSNGISNLTGGAIKLSDEDYKTNINYDRKDVQKFMDRIKPAAYDYKKDVQDSPLASNQRELGVMAQDLQKSKLGKQAVTDTQAGKVVDYDNLQPKMLASIAALNQRLKELETGKKK